MNDVQLGVVAVGRTHISPGGGGRRPVAPALLGASPAIDGRKVELAAWRSLRTLLQGLAAALPAAGVGSTILSTSYWATVGYSCLAATVTAGASFLQNVATFLPDDPTQASEGPGAAAGGWSSTSTGQPVAP